MIRERGAPSIWMKQNLNTVRLMHLQRRREVQDACDTCGKPITGKTHWRIRGLLKFPTDEPGENPMNVIAHACREACAREIFDQLRVEVALFTNKKPEVTVTER